MSLLRRFPVNNTYIDIAEQIAPDYLMFGTLLLNDTNGNKVHSITVANHDSPLDISVEILKQWLFGKGRQPVTWQTLIKCLRDTDLIILAVHMEDSLVVS